MLKEIFIIGVGGQGAQSIGEILLIAANMKGYAASFYPFYGSQMRGGESGCIVKIDTESDEILNPTITSPDDFLILSDKFLDKYIKYANDKSKYYKADDHIDKNKNLTLLRKYIETDNLFDNSVVEEAITKKFKRRDKQL